jgi:APA family basic amino acid/polyamine antiporter
MSLPGWGTPPAWRRWPRGSVRIFEEVTRRAAELLAEHLPHTEGEVARVFMQGTAIGTTVMTHGVALPHFREPGLSAPVLLAVRIREGVPADTYDPFGGQHHVSQPLHAILYLVSPEALPALHLQVLARLAQQVEGEGFLEHWMHAPDAAGLKEALLREERSLTLTLNTGHAMVGRPLQEAPLPSGCLVALVRREGEIFVPSGTSLLQEGDRLTILGNPGELGRLAGEELRTASDPG